MVDEIKNKGGEFENLVVHYINGVMKANAPLLNH